MTARSATHPLLEWAEGHRRDLPWRRTRDAWRVLVSEVMLQQTQVARVLGPYEAFISRFPDPTTCASAEVGEVVRRWEGLGYNRRAVSLHRAAVCIVERHGGRVPDEIDALLALPGVGPYTARAVLAFADERDVGVVDTNAARVLARRAGRSLGRREVQQMADESVPPGQAWAWNQAMLDLGATVCTSRRPRCDECPVTGGCEWHRAGCPDPDPAVGSAGVTTGQSRFEGSDRQGRGRLVASLRRDGRVAASRMAEAAGWPEDTGRATAVAVGLVRDGLAVADPDGSIRLP